MAKFIIEQILTQTGDPADDFLKVGFLIVDGTDLIDEQYVDWAVAPYNSEDDLRDAMVNAIVGWANSNGYSGTVATDVLNYKPGKRIFATPSRSLNSAFQISAYRDADVSYSVDIATSVSLSGGAVGTVFLEYADDSGFTTNVKEVQRYVNGNTGTLVIGLTLNQTATAPLHGIIPAGKYARIRTANTTGTPTFTFRSAHEALV